MNKTKVLKNVIVTSAVVALGMVFTQKNAYASCETQYGGNETCIVNKSFKITKQVRIEGDNSWKSKVILDNDEKDETVEFKIKVEFRKIDENGDTVDDVSIDGMKMSDELPDELKRIGGSGLTEYWDDFKPGESKTFVIKAQVKDSEFDDDKNFEKCVVNKVKVYRNKDFEGSDTATVCFGNDTEIKELPKTGFDTATIMATLGSATTGLGLFVKKLTSKVSK